MSDHGTEREPIEPALTAEEWACAMDEDVREGLAYEVTYLWGTSRPAATIALANAALKDDDKRKITRAMVRQIRESADHTHLVEISWKNLGAPQEAARKRDFLLAIADALSSYLPPEVP